MQEAVLSPRGCGGCLTVNGALWRRLCAAAAEGLQGGPGVPHLPARRHCHQRLQARRYYHEGALHSGPAPQVRAEAGGFAPDWPLQPSAALGCPIAPLPSCPASCCSSSRHPIKCTPGPWVQHSWGSACEQHSVRAWLRRPRLHPALSLLGHRPPSLCCSPAVPRCPAPRCPGSGPPCPAGTLTTQPLLPSMRATFWMRCTMTPPTTRRGTFSGARTRGRRGRSRPRWVLARVPGWGLPRRHAAAARAPGWRPCAGCAGAPLRARPPAPASPAAPHAAFSLWLAPRPLAALPCANLLYPCSCPAGVH